MSLIASLVRLSRLARENSDALEAARGKYDAGATLATVLSSFSESTGGGYDDHLADAVGALIGDISNVLYNTHTALTGVAQSLDSIQEVLNDLLVKPLKEVLEGD